MFTWQPDDTDTKSLSARFLWTALPIIGISTVALFLIFGLMSFRALEHELLHKIEQTADINSEVLATPFWYLETGDADSILRRCGSAWTRATYADTQNIDNALRVMVQDTDIVAVVARDSDGTEFCRRGLEADRLNGFDPISRRLYDVVSRRVYFTYNDTRRDVGELEIHFTKNRIHEWVEKRTYFNMALLVLLLIAAAASFFIANRRSIKAPLDLLLQSVRMSKDGRTRKPIDWHSQDELGQLIQEYNEMVQLQTDAQEQTHAKQALLEATFHNMRQSICVLNEDLEVLVWNEQYQQMFGFPDDFLRVGAPITDLIRFNAERGEYGNIGAEEAIDDWVTTIRRGEPYVTERIRPNNRVILVEINPMPQGGHIAVYTDITERKQVEARMRHMALHDALTGLPNRTLFTDRLHHAVSSARRHNQGVAVMFIDLDRFKDVNDTFGHDIGDMLIQEMGRRLAEVIRDSDTAARLGGDEFAVIQNDVEKIEDVVVLAERIITEITRPFSVLGHMLHTTASIGLTLFPEDTDNPEQLLKNADIAMYVAKAKGRNNYRFFTSKRTSA